jgi:glycosyltransferase involved in cell wall biosynthesis
MKGGVLFISYSGMLEPLGQSQVLAYQERLADDHPIYLLSFERPADWANTTEREIVARRIRNAGIHWYPLRYHKQFSVLATLWDIVSGTFVGGYLVIRNRLSVVHARSYVPAAMALLIKRAVGTKLIFDMRGFWADERVDGGLWPRYGILHRAAKWLEQTLLLSADHVVSLTHAGVREIQSFDYMQGAVPPTTVIPTCADLERFKPLSVSKGGPFVLGYVGSAGTWYLFDVVVACFIHLRKLRPDARLLIINRKEHEYIRTCLDAGGVPAEVVELRSASHAEIPEQMGRMDATAFFIKPVFSKQASAPTKLAEFLGCGVPCLSNAGVGDMAEVLEGDRVGVTVQDFNPASLEIGARQLLALLEESGIRERCVAAAWRHFSLDHAVQLYRSVYKSVYSPER